MKKMKTYQFSLRRKKARDTIFLPSTQKWIKVKGKTKDDALKKARKMARKQSLVVNR